VRLALLDRAGADAGDLVRAQRGQVAPIAAALDERLRSVEGHERTVMLWRREAMSPALRFLDAADSSPQARETAPTAGKAGPRPCPVEKRNA
jgi:hypothetical protein